MAYNYFDAVKADIMDWITSEDFDVNSFDDRYEAEEELNDSLWDNDDVTGNGSGSYTSVAQSKDYVFNSDDGTELLASAIGDFGIDAKSIATHMMNEDWDWFDVTIRCYVLNQAISEVVDELWEK